MSDPFAQFLQFGPLFHRVVDNAYVGELFGLARPEWMKLPDGTNIRTAVPGQEDSLTYWLQGANGNYHYITQAQSFVQDLFLHYATGSALHLTPSYGENTLRLYTAPAHLTTEELMFAVHTMPEGLGNALVNTFTEQAIIDYAMQEAPAVVLIGTPHMGDTGV